MCWVLCAQQGQRTHPGPTLEAHCLLPGSQLLWASWLPLRQVRWAVWPLQQDVSRSDGHPPGEGSGQVLPPSPRQPPPLQSAQGMVEPQDGQPGSLIPCGGGHLAEHCPVCLVGSKSSLVCFGCSNNQ